MLVEQQAGAEEKRLHLNVPPPPDEELQRLAKSPSWDD